jgi:hypothetical protein
MLEGHLQLSSSFWKLHKWGTHCINSNITEKYTDRNILVNFLQVVIYLALEANI